MNQKDNLTDLVEITSDTDTSPEDNSGTDWEVSDNDGESVTLDVDNVETKDN